GRLSTVTGALHGTGRTWRLPGTPVDLRLTSVERARARSSRRSGGSTRFAGGVTRRAPSYQARSTTLNRSDANCRRSLALIFARRDIGSAGLDDVGQAALPEQPSDLVEMAAVARAEEALRVERLIDRHADIAQHQGRALDRNLSPLPARQHRTRQGIDDLHRVAGQHLAVTASGHLLRRAGGEGGADGERLRTAIRRRLAP